MVTAVMFGATQQRNGRFFLAIVDSKNHPGGNNIT
jgi:hypothetical protein